MAGKVNVKFVSFRVNTQISIARRATDVGPTMNFPFHFDSEDPMTTTFNPDMNPGDEAAPGTPGAAEDLCQACEGKGKLANGQPCPECGGTGRVMRGIGGG